MLQFVTNAEREVLNLPLCTNVPQFQTSLDIRSLYGVDRLYLKDRTILMDYSGTRLFVATILTMLPIAIKFTGSRRRIDILFQDTTVARSINLPLIGMGMYVPKERFATTPEEISEYLITSPF